MGARRLGQDEQYWTVREILSKASTLADGALSRERSDFYRFGYATFGYHLSTVHYCCSSDDLIHSTKQKILGFQVSGVNVEDSGVRCQVSVLCFFPDT